jgi:hypothetical protein
VEIAGIDVGGLHAAEARRLVEVRLAQRLRDPVHVVYGTHRFTIHPTQAGLHIDIEKMVEAAVQTSRSGGLAHRFFRDVGGQPLRATIPLRGVLSRGRLASFVDRVARVISRPAQSARVEPTPLATGIRIVPSHLGLAVKRPRLARALTAALLSFDGRRTIAVPTRPVHPRWWTSTLARHYRTYVLVSRETFTLRLYKNLKLVKTYRIAVGRAGLETPAGEYTINDKQINPSWHVPLSSWAGALAGRIIPPGPDDPLKSRWLGFFGGAGIHGTVDTWSIGTAASHGCIRMTIPDVEDLYPRVPLHSPIYVG